MNVIEFPGNRIGKRFFPSTSQVIKFDINFSKMKIYYEIIQNDFKIWGFGKNWQIAGINAARAIKDSIKDPKEQRLTKQRFKRGMATKEFIETIYHKDKVPLNQVQNILAA